MSGSGVSGAPGGSRYVTVDSGTTLLPIVGDAVGHREPRALVVARSSMTDIVNALFERYWEAGTTMRGGTPSSSAPGELSDEDTTLLNLLANGLPNAAIAHQIDCSDRTLRRRIGQLGDALDASSRFQLGVHARERGWI